MDHHPSIRYAAECLGTFILVFLGLGSAIFSGDQIGILGVALCFGLALTLLAASLGAVSGAHLNPAVTLTMALSKNMERRDVTRYIVAQLLGALVAGIVLYIIALGKVDFSLHKGFATTGYGESSPSGYSLFSCFIVEMIVTAILCFVALATTRSYFPSNFQSLVMGMTLAALILVAAPISNASVNVARSVGVAVIHGGHAMVQLWLFVAAHVCSVFIALGLARWTLPERVR